MAGPRHNWDEQSHKNLFDKVYNTITTAVNSLTKLVNDNLGDIKKATHLPTPNTLMKRDEHGRVRVTEPVHELDVVTKGMLDKLPSLSVQVFKASGTYTAKETGPHLVICVGGGGGGQGGARDSTSSDGGRGIRHGDVVYLKKNVDYPVVIGGGGRGGTGDFNQGTAGAAGGASSFGTNIVYSAGGLGGAQGTSYGNRIGWTFSDLDIVLPIPADGYGAGGAKGAKSGNKYPGQAGSQGLTVVFSMGEV